MSLERMLAVRNLQRRPARTAALLLLSAFLALAVCGGTIVITSLRRGLQSYEARLGADIVAVPYEARTKGSFDAILLQGIPGTFYMDGKYYEKIAATEGVEQAAPQFFLASASAGCCSVPVQIIGIDPEKDFTIRPWIRESYEGTLGDGDILVGSRINVPPDRSLIFYNTPCRIAGQLDDTGTGLDTAVFTSMNTIRTMMKNSQELGFHYFDGTDPGSAVSSVMVRVAEGYDIDQVAGDINIHVRHVEAAPAAGMVSGIAAGLKGISGAIGVLSLLVWALSLAVLAIVFAMTARERAREFAVLRVMGASRSRIFRLLLTESALVSFLGALAGAVLALLLSVSFSGLVKSALKLPYLLPSPGRLLVLAAAAVLLTTVSGAVASASSARRVTGSDTDLILREDL